MDIHSSVQKMHYNRNWQLQPLQKEGRNLVTYPTLSSLEEELYKHVKNKKGTCILLIVFLEYQQTILFEIVQDLSYRWISMPKENRQFFLFSHYILLVDDIL